MKYSTIVAVAAMAGALAAGCGQNLDPDPAGPGGGGTPDAGTVGAADSGLPPCTATTGTAGAACRVGQALAAARAAMNAPDVKAIVDSAATIADALEQVQAGTTPDVQAANALKAANAAIAALERSPQLIQACADAADAANAAVVDATVALETEAAAGKANAQRAFDDATAIDTEVTAVHTAAGGFEAQDWEESGVSLANETALAEKSAEWAELLLQPALADALTAVGTSLGDLALANVALFAAIELIP